MGTIVVGGVLVVVLVVAIRSVIKRGTSGCCSSGGSCGGGCGCHASVYAVVDSDLKKAHVHMKSKVDETVLRKAVNDLGEYTVLSVDWIK